METRLNIEAIEDGSIPLSKLEEIPNGSYDDTEVKQELAKLSTEIEQVSEKVDELGKPIFKAIYGETTYEEIKAAYESGMVVHCDYETYCYVLSRINEGAAYFTTTLMGTNYVIYCSNGTNKWNPLRYTLEESKNKTTTISESSTDTQYPSAKAVYDALQNVGGGGGGINTPSGSLIHDLLVMVGMEYNATDADIIKSAPWKDMVDNEDEKTVIHKAGHWYLNGLGDLTTEEAQKIYARGWWNEAERYPLGYSSSLPYFYRTFLPRKGGVNGTGSSLSISGYNTAVEVINLGIIPFQNNFYAPNYSLSGNNMNVFTNNSALKHLFGNHLVYNITNDASAFSGCSKLVSVAIKANQGVNLKDSPLLSYASIKWLIKNSAPSAQITITLHASALANAETRYLADAEQDNTTYPTLSDWALSKKIQIATA